MNDLLYWLLSNSHMLVFSGICGTVGYGIGRAWSEYKQSNALSDHMINRTPLKDLDAEYMILTTEQLRGLLTHAPIWVQKAWEGKLP